ncbi:hypothetical protein [Beijerinckia sp. L45]|uniref:hypothetical protein n=1 Tax=Beijerinckia sp. L45 TaxID=1641855 RepID=UPI00131B6DEB|nr:hypothetical protein [Beijerinckia sp. L45]
MGKIMDFRKTNLASGRLPSGFNAAKERAAFWARKAAECSETEAALNRVEAEMTRLRTGSKKYTTN